MEESKKPEGRRRQNFLVVRRVARAFRLAVEHRDLFLAPLLSLMLVYGILCLSPAVLIVFEDLEVCSVQHVD